MVLSAMYSYDKYEFYGTIFRILWSVSESITFDFDICIKLTKVVECRLTMQGLLEL